MATSTWQSLMGLARDSSALEDVHGTTTDAAKAAVNANPRDNTEPVVRVTDEFRDQSEPHPQIGDTNAADSATQSGNTADYTRTHETEVAYDGYGGRGTGKKFVTADWDASR